jgi:hypothetical protein
MVQIRISKNLKTLTKVMKEMGACTAEDLIDSINETTINASEVAKQALAETEHTQKYGDELVNEIGVKPASLTRLNAQIYAPINDTEEMRNQMLFAEFGAGITATGDNKYFKKPQFTEKQQKDSKGRWYYISTENDKNPDNFYKYNKKGELLLRTDRSEPARFMYQAREYISQNAIKSVRRFIHARLGRNNSFNDEE